ncbi:hypothetical protein BD779DRAFT_1453610 [Infundibulicybe gibba]|nr:hypothetical protein BD779DRAFT_1453610 [Infundibulicybe gibba]
MSPDEVPLFSGDRSDPVQPDEFVKAFRRAMRKGAGGTLPTDQTMVEAFEDNLKSRSPAERWFREEDRSKTAWTRVEEAFLMRFPRKEKGEDRDELERELWEMRLPSEELGKKRKYEGRERWPHTEYAERALDLAERAGISEAPVSVWRLEGKISNIILTRLDGKYSNWDEFCEAVKAIPASYITAELERERMVTRLADEMQRMQSSMRSLTLQRQATAVASPPAMGAWARGGAGWNGPSRGPWGSSPGGIQAATLPVPMPPAAALAPAPPRTPEEKRAAVRAQLAAWPLQSDTEAGRAAYRVQWQTWRGQYGEARPSEDTGFPLKPGTLPVGSGECYTCGKGGHRADACTVAQPDRIPGKERVWRMVAGSILGRRGVEVPASINAVGLEQEDETAWMDYVGPGDSEEGNGEGPPV